MAWVLLLQCLPEASSASLAASWIRYELAVSKHNVETFKRKRLKCCTAIWKKRGLIYQVQVNSLKIKSGGFYEKYNHTYPLTYLCLADFFEVSITHLMTLSRWQLLKSQYYTLVGRTKKEKYKDKKGQGDTDTSLGRQENKEKWTNR